MEKEAPGPDGFSVDPTPIPTGGVITLVIDGALGAGEWISVNIALDPATA